MEIFLLLETWVALLTLTFLEVILGVDNIIFISIVTNKLPKHKRAKGRTIGLVMALVFRVVLLALISWLIHHLTEPLFTFFGLGFSIREIILFLGGLFLLGKSVSEIHAKMEGHSHSEAAVVYTSLFRVIIQIVLLDLVFSFDSILTAVGLTENLLIMIVAVVIAMGIMMIFAGRISRFINNHPTFEILALSFLILIGFMLVLEGFHKEIPKGYIYFAVFFSLLVELVNMRIRKKQKPVATYNKAKIVEKLKESEVRQ